VGAIGSRPDITDSQAYAHKLRHEGEIRLIIPEAMQKAYGMATGQEFVLIDTGDGILLKPKKPFPQTTLSDVAGCLKYQGEPKTIEEMNDAIRQGNC
jgi:bifunctional DNA-binding transcriptional regulator/antitoxin component of YhaV-PrlF toxin-antitoxin module